MSSDNSEKLEGSKNWWQRRSRWQQWLIAGVAAVVVATAWFGSGEEEDGGLAAGDTTTTEAAAATTSEAAATTTAAVEESTAAVVTSAATTTTATSTTTTTVATTTTTVATTTTTTTTVPATTTTEASVIIEAGVYEVGEDFPPGVYRVLPNYWARLDAGQEIIDNDLVEDCPSIMVVEESDAFVEITGGAVPVEESDPVDPFECTDGTFLVGVDIEAGQYTVQPVAGTTYWARLDENREIIDNHLGEGQAILVIQESDYAITFNGQLEGDS